MVVENFENLTYYFFIVIIFPDFIILKIILGRILDHLVFLYCHIFIVLHYFYFIYLKQARTIYR